jgi:hypothetical protein
VVVSVVWGRCKNNRGSFLFVPEYDSLIHDTALSTTPSTSTQPLVLSKHPGKRMSFRLFGNIGRAPRT